MHKNFIQAIAPIFGLALLSGCGASVLTNEKMNIFGTEPVVVKEPFETIDLALILQPKIKPDSSLLSVEGEAAKRHLLESAFQEFNTVYTVNSVTGIRHRNSIQQRIVAASNQRCGEYKKFLKAMDARSNFFLGTLTSALAGAGAIFTRVDTVRALSGLAGIVSGTRAEFNQEYFANQTIQVLTDAFYKRRAKIQTSLIKKGKKNLLDYPVERAVADAVRYHENCSLIAGLEEAALAVTRISDPGAKQVNKFQTLARNISLGESVTTAIHHEAAAAGVVGASAAALARAEEKVASAQETLKAAVGAAAQNSAGSKLKTAEAERDAAKALHEKAQNELAKRKGVVEYYKNSVKSSESKNPAPDNPPSSESDASEIAEKAALTNGIKEIQDGGETKDSDVDKDPKPASKIGAAKTTKVESQPLPK